MDTVSAAKDVFKPASGNRFVVAGAAMASLRKRLRVALPQRRQPASCHVIMTAADNRVTFAVVGAVIEVQAVTTGAFTADVPYSLFKPALTDPYDDAAMIVFEFHMGSFAVNGVRTTSPDIILRLGQGTGGTSHVPSIVASPAIPDEFDTPIGLPLIAAYKHIRKYGRTVDTASRTFAQQQVEVDALLTRAGKLLMPVGLTKTDLEDLLDRKLGIR